MWTFKMFFQDDGEFFEYDPFGMQGTVGTEKALPYLESFLSFLELEPADWEPLIQQTALDLEQFLSTEAPAHADRMMQTLGELSGRHIYFQLLYLQWFARKAAGNIESRMTEELRLLPVQLTAYRKQAQTFLERILDIDQVGRDVRKNMGEADRFDCPKDDTLFCFEPSPISFGVSTAAKGSIRTIATPICCLSVRTHICWPWDKVCPNERIVPAAIIIIAEFFHISSLHFSSP